MVSISSGDLPGSYTAALVEETSADRPSSKYPARERTLPGLEHTTAAGYAPTESLSEGVSRAAAKISEELQWAKEKTPFLGSGGHAQPPPPPSLTEQYV